MRAAGFVLLLMLCSSWYHPIHVSVTNMDIDPGGKIISLKIRDTIMLEKFDDQANLLIVDCNEMQNGYRMNNKNTESTLNIQ
jgi:hypothetical protein